MQSNSKKITFPLKNFSFLEFESIDSTNTWAKTHLDSFDQSKITCVYALHQTHGRGRLNRSWVSTPGTNILASFVFFLPSPFSYLLNLAQVLMCSCLTVLHNHQLQVELKWPNDLFLNQKKLSGVLCETSQMKDKTAAILGIGLNVNMPQEAFEEIPQPATSLLVETGHSWDWKSLLEEIAQQFEQDLQILKQNGFASFATLMNQYLYKKGKLIVVKTTTQEVSGVCQGIASDGSLELIGEAGQIIRIYSGDINEANSENLRQE